MSFKGIPANRKTAEDSLLSSHSVFPFFNQQAKWQYARYPNALHLLNPVDSKVYHFALPEGAKEDDRFDAFRSSDIPVSEFGRDAESKGVAQIHSSGPDKLYFTIQEGRTNPTITLQHAEGTKWHGIPKKRKSKPTTEAVYQTKQAAPWYDPVAAAAKATTTAGNTLGHLGDNPLMSAAVGGAAGLAYDQLRRGFYNTEAENHNESFMQRLARLAVPAAGLGLSGALLRNAFPNHYAPVQSNS